MEAEPDGVAMMRSFIQRKRREDAERRRADLVRGTTFQDISDIDVALSGITDAEQFFLLYGMAQTLQLMAEMGKRLDAFESDIIPIWIAGVGMRTFWKR